MNCRYEFEKIIENIEINNNTTPEEFKSQLQPLIEFIQNNIPKQLFRFRSCTEYNFDAFENDQIWLSKASMFNDPHDSLLFFDKPSILEQAKKIFSVQNIPAILQYLKQYQTSLPQTDFLNPDMQSLIANRLDLLDEQTLSGLIQQMIPNLDTFLDTLFTNLKSEIRNQLKMACLSESIESPLMWAHYADNHKGFALEYDFRGNNISQCTNCPNHSCNNIRLATIYPMIYSDKRFDATSYGKWRVEQYIKSYLGIVAETNYKDDFLSIRAALHKSNDWKYENEWRIICSTPNPITEQQNRYPIIKKPIAIYFGCQIPDIYRKMLTHIADEKGIAKYQMYVKDYSYKYELDYESF